MKGISEMTPDSINALMSAIKMKEASGAGLPPDEAAGTPSEPQDGTHPDPDDTDQEDAGTNAKIVDILQSQYPRIFAKISSMVDDDPDTQTDDASAPVAPPAAMG